MFQAIGLIIVVNFLLYFRTLRFKFVSDDFSVWKNPPVARNWWHKKWQQFTGSSKIFTWSTHFVRANGKWFMAFTKSEEMEHFVTLLIHTAICIAIYFAFGANWVSFVAALMYSTNPVNNQGTIWPSGRGYALPVLSLLLAVCIPWLSPILLGFCTWYTIGFHGVLGLVGTDKLYLLAMVPLLWAWHRRKFSTSIKFKHETEAFSHDRKFDLSKIVVFFKTLGFYLTLCVIPFRITFYHNFLQSMAGNEIMRKRANKMDRYFFVGVTATIAIILNAVLNWGPQAQAFLAFLITMAPFCNVIRANQEIAERFVTLPDVFLMVGVAHFIAPYPVVIAAFLTFYATRAYYTIGLYKDEYWITEYAVVEDPHAWWAWHCRAMKRWETQSYREAMILWVMAKLISPKEFKVLNNIAVCLRLLGNHKEADEYLKLAEENIVEGQEEVAMKSVEDHRKGKFSIHL